MGGTPSSSPIGRHIAIHIIANIIKIIPLAVAMTIIANRAGMSPTLSISHIPTLLLRANASDNIEQVAGSAVTAVNNSYLH